MRPIDADRLKQEISIVGYSGTYDKAFIIDVIDVIDEQPTCAYCHNCIFEGAKLRRENGRSDRMTLKEAINQLELLRNFVFENDKDAMDNAIQVLKWLEQGTEKGTVKGMEE